MTKNNIIHGPELWTPIPEESLGKQIHRSLLRADAKDVAYEDTTNGHRVTYKEFFESTCRLANSLSNCGYKANDVISICSENNCYFFTPVIAAFYLGIIPAPLNHTYSSGELHHTLNISKPKVIFCSKSVVGTFLKLKEKENFIEKIIIIQPNEFVHGLDNVAQFIQKNCSADFLLQNFVPVDINPFEHLAVILNSSGTTGLPKGVMTTHDNISMRVNHLYDPRLHITSHEVVLGVLPFFHGYGFMTNIGALTRRNTIIVLQRFEENLFLSCVQKYKISTLNVVPPLMIFFAKSPLISKYDLSSVVELTSGAAPLSKEIEAAVEKRLPNIKTIRQGYGLTEATLAVLLMPVGESKIGSSGKVVPGMSCIVRDTESGKHLGPNEVGELCFKGRMVMKGYYGNPEATRNSFSSDGWLLSGDLGYYDAEGYFYVVDRLKELIKYKGFQVAPAELEALLLTHPLIKDAAVIGLPDDQAGELPLAFVVKVPEARLSEKEVQQFIAGKVSRPKQLHGGVKFVAEIPKNPSGKILRRQLREVVQELKSKL